MRAFLALALITALQFLAPPSDAAVAMVQTVFVAVSSSGFTFTSSAFPAIGAGDVIVGNWTFQNNTNSTFTATVTDNAGTGNTYSTSVGYWDLNGVGSGGSGVLAFWGTNITGNPTAFTITLSISPSNAPLWINPLMVTEYSGAASVGVAPVGPTTVDSANPSISIMTAVANSMVYEFVASDDSAAPSAPSGFTMIENHSGSGQYAANAIIPSAGVVNAPWTSNGTLANINTLFAATLVPSGVVTGTPSRALLGVGQ